MLSESFSFFFVLTLSLFSVPRRASSSAQHAGRGGAGNVFKGEEAELARKASNDQAVDDSPESVVAKGKNWFFGKKA